MNLAIREIKTVRDGDEICMRYGRVLPEDREVADITVQGIGGVVFAAEDVERITARNWQRGKAIRAARNDRRAARERARRRQLDGITQIGLFGLLLGVFGFSFLCPAAWFLLALDLLALGALLWRYLK